MGLTLAEAKQILARCAASRDGRAVPILCGVETCLLVSVMEGERWLVKFGHVYKWNRLPESGTFVADQERE